METFRGLQKKHELLLKRQQSGKPVVKEAEDYLIATFNAGIYITNPAQRDQLISNNRYWAIYIFEKTGIFPKTELSSPDKKALTRRKYIVWFFRASGVLLLLSTVIGIYLFFTGKKITVEATQPIVCTPQAPNVNIYRTTPQTWVNMIFQYAATSIPPSEQQILGARYAAFQYLINETKRWSDTETIKLDDSSEAQIIVTFISPELLQAVFLSEVLKHRLFFSDFETQTQTMLNSVAARDELLFLLTITTTNNGSIDLLPHIIDIPIKQMALTNGAGLQIAPKHNDQYLDKPIDSSSKPVFGYLAYPLAVLANSECKWVLEPKYNTSIVITIPVIQLDGVNSGPYTWTIPYSSLIQADIPPTPPNFMMPPAFDQNQMLPLAMPPNEINQTNYWQDFARFIWNQITLANYK